MSSYGCYNRAPYLPVNTIPARWPGDEPLHILFTMSPDCQYTYTELGQSDAGCVGCEHKTSETNR